MKQMLTNSQTNLKQTHTITHKHKLTGHVALFPPPFNYFNWQGSSNTIIIINIISRMPATLFNILIKIC